MGRPRGLAREMEGCAKLSAVAASVPPLTTKNSRREGAMIPPGCFRDFWPGFLTGQIVAEFGPECSEVRLRGTLFGFVRRTLHPGVARGIFCGASGEVSVVGRMGFQRVWRNVDGSIASLGLRCGGCGGGCGGAPGGGLGRGQRHTG